MLRAISQAWRLVIFRPPALLGLVLEHVALARAAPQEQRVHAQQRADREAHAPAPFLHRRLAQPGRQQRGQPRGGHDAERHAHEHGTGPEAAPGRGRDFGHVGVGHAGLAAVGQALHQAAGEQQDRGEHAGLLVGGQHGDAQAGQRQQAHREHQRELAAVAVADAAEQPAAHRAGEKAAGEHPQRGQQRRGRVRRVEQVHGQIGRERAVQRPVEPFEGIAHGRGAQRGQAAPAVLCLHCYRRHCCRPWGFSADGARTSPRLRGWCGRSVPCRPSNGRRAAAGAAWAGRPR